MKNFIEVTEIAIERKNLMPITRISAVEERNDGTALIILKNEVSKRKYNTICIYIIETYDNIKQQLEEASK